MGTPRDSAPSVKAVRRRILRSKNRFWLPAQLGIAPSTAQHLLADLVTSGELKRVRKGLYWRGTRTPLGMSAPKPDDIVAILAPGAGVGPAGLSAANFLRLSTQIPRRAEIAVPRRSPTGVSTVRFLSRSARRGRRTCSLTPFEVAVLEVLEGWERVIEVSPEEATRRLVDLMGTGALRLDRLARASSTEPAPVRARLRSLLEASDRADLAARIPLPDPRSEKKALASLASAR